MDRPTVRRVGVRTGLVVAWVTAFIVIIALLGMSLVK